MKKIWLNFLLLILGAAVLFGIGFYIYNYFEGGTDYYMKVTSGPLRKEDAKDDKGDIRGTIYHYNMTGFDDEGKAKEIDFTVNKEQPLKTNAYIKLRFNPNKGPINWGEVKKSEVPELAIKQLN